MLGTVDSPAKSEMNVINLAKGPPRPPHPRTPVFRITQPVGPAILRPRSEVQVLPQQGQRQSQPQDQDVLHRADVAPAIAAPSRLPLEQRERSRSMSELSEPPSHSRESSTIHKRTDAAYPSAHPSPDEVCFSHASLRRI